MKKVNSFDVADGIWDFMKSGNIEKTKGLSWRKTVAFIMRNHNIEDFIADEGVKKFLYEKDYFFSKPNRKTMEHLWGEHVMLYDIFGCSKHMFTLRTSDDCYEYVDGKTVCCPFCNQDVMTSEKFNRYLELGKVYSSDEWIDVMKTAKFHKKWNKKENFRYMMKHLFDIHYWKMRIKFGF